MKSKDITGLKFNFLTVLKLHHKKQRFNKDGSSKGYLEYWLCQCDCGKQTIVEKYHITHSRIKSCGCYLEKRRKESHTKHLLCNSRIYKIWGDMKNRCSNPHNHAYKYYGTRGITFYSEWINFESFYNWALNNGYKDNLTLDRINYNGNYEPSNCRWVTKKVQARNTSKNTFITYKNETHCLSEWAEIFNIDYNMLWKRLSSGWAFEEAINTPKLNQSEAGKRQKRIKKVYCNEINIIFNSAKEAEDYFIKIKGKKIYGVSRSCKSEFLKAGGYKWYYYQEQKNI